MTPEAASSRICLSYFHEPWPSCAVPLSSTVLWLRGEGGVLDISLQIYRDKKHTVNYTLFYILIAYLNHVSF